MSSHREAPEISKDPVADSTDVYAFVSPDRDTHVTILANYIPLQKPDGAPNFYEFGEDVLYEIHVSNNNNPAPDVTYQFRFRTEIRNKKTFLYNTGVIDSIDSPNWNRPQYYSVTRKTPNGSRVLADNVPCPPVNVGVRSTPDYASLAQQATRNIRGGRRVFCGQRADAFHVDLGSIFDLGALRPFNDAHVIPIMGEMDGINSVQSFNVHTIAIQVPITDLTRDGDAPTDPEDRQSTIGIWTSASRRKNRMYNENTGVYDGTGPFRQVSRLANPLFNEVIVPMAEKDKWNSVTPAEDGPFEKYVNKPELAALLPDLYPGVFPKLKAYTKPRADLNAILLTGIPKDVVPGFANYTGPVPSDLLRLNVAVPPTEVGQESIYGLIDNDAAGFPNGRRPLDDIVAIELRAVAGVTIPLVDPTYGDPDPAAGQLTDGTTNTNAELLDEFPYLGLPGGGYQTKPGTTEAD